MNSHQGIRPIVADWDAGGHRPGAGENAHVWRDALADVDGLLPPRVLNRRLGEVLPTALRAVAASVLDAGETPLVLGGDHSVTYPVLHAVAHRFGLVDVHLLDAHHDHHPSPARSNYAVFRFAERDLGVRMVRHGLREPLPDDCPPHDPTADPRRHAYLTIDVDYFDPALVGSVNWPMPVPDGMTCDLQAAGALLDAIARDHVVVGADIVEWCGQRADDDERALVAGLLGMVVHTIHASRQVAEEEVVHAR